VHKVDKDDDDDNNNNSIVYHLCADTKAIRPITETAQEHKAKTQITSDKRKNIKGVIRNRVSKILTYSMEQSHS
jgi:hypothetical protein